MRRARQVSTVGYIQALRDRAASPRMTAFDLWLDAADAAFDRFCAWAAPKLGGLLVLGLVLLFIVIGFGA